MKTIFCDIDGTLCVHHEDIIKQHRDELTLLPETLDVLKEWEKLTGEVSFKIKANPINRGSTFTDFRDGQTYKTVLVKDAEPGVSAVVSYRTCLRWRHQ